MPDLSAFSALRHLELSYNAIHSLAPLKACGATRLEELYAASNKIAEVCAAWQLRSFLLISWVSKMCVAATREDVRCMLGDPPLPEHRMMVWCPPMLR